VCGVIGNIGGSESGDRFIMCGNLCAAVNCEQLRGCNWSSIARGLALWPRLVLFYSTPPNFPLFRCQRSLTSNQVHPLCPIGPHKLAITNQLSRQPWTMGWKIRGETPGNRQGKQEVLASVCHRSLFLKESHSQFASEYVYHSTAESKSGSRLLPGFS